MSASAEGNASSDAIATAVVACHMIGCSSAQAPVREVFGLASWCCLRYRIEVLCYVGGMPMNQIYCTTAIGSEEVRE
jgi:hypothetical protein